MCSDIHKRVLGFGELRIRSFKDSRKVCRAARTTWWKDWVKESIGQGDLVMEKWMTRKWEIYV